MTSPQSAGEVFISFSSKDLPVGKLFSALATQNVKVWDYGDQGQELPLGHQVSNALLSKIDACEYFIAVISPNSTDPEIGKHTILEVRYAIASGKITRNQLLPLLLDTPANWLDLYPELKQHGTLWDVLDHENEERFENSIRRICEWLSVPYVPSALRDQRAFFSDLLLAEIENQKPSKANFVKLILQSNNLGRHILNEEWAEARESIDLLMGLAKKMSPPLPLRYVLVLRGICELQLNELETAEQTFLEAIKDEDLGTNPLLGLGYAGLGHTYFAMGRFNEALTAFENALELTADDYLQFSYQAAILSAGRTTVDESIVRQFENATLTADEQRKLLTLKGALHYNRGEYAQAIRIFGDLTVDQLDETSAIFYALALQENGEVGHAIDVLSSVADRTKSIDLYHYLADAYWYAGETRSAFAVYETYLNIITTPSTYARQLLVEYARMVRQIEGNESAKARGALERAVDLAVLAPPQSKADFFFTGFAHYLLGKTELAKYFFDSSSGFSNDYYDELLAHHVG